jgi:Ca-activated chloride channel family protein
MELLRPALLWTLAGAFVVLAAGLWARARARRELSAWVGERHAARFVPGHSPGRATTRVVLASAGLALLALALLGPVVGHTFRPVSRRGLDLVVCLDTSRSMLAQDLRPSRLERAKREIAGLLERLAGDRVALVAFSGEARDVSPLTRDRATLENLLAYVTSEDNQKGGTDLAAAIARGLDLLDGRSGAHEAIVLITDGEDLEGQGLALAEKAVERGIRIFVLGVGTVEGGKIPVVDASGKQSFLADEEGKEVVTKLDRTSLMELARRTGGEFLAADESATPLEDLYRARITRIEGREITSGERRVPYDRFQWPLVAGIACLLGATALRARRRSAAARPAGARLAAALLCLPLGGEPRQEPAERLERAADALARGELEQAELAAAALLEELTAAGFAEADRARAELALGVIRAALAEGEKDDAKSLTAFENALANFSAARALAGPGTLRLDATYDLGTAELFRGERWRARIPEVSGQPEQPGGLPGMPPAAAPGGPDDGPPPPDPLAEARKHYLAARTWLGERLRADARDADTRANLELVQRRLRELEKIEEEREKQEQEQQNQDQENQDQQDQDQQDQDQQDQEKKDQKEQKNEDPKDQKDPQDSEQKDQPPQDPQDPKDGEQDPKPQEKPEQQEGEPKPEQEAQEQEEPQGQPEERVLTREEVMQLLDQLAELEKQQKALEAQLRAKRSKAKRDW